MIILNYFDSNKSFNFRKIFIFVIYLQQTSIYYTHYEIECHQCILINEILVVFHNKSWTSGCAICYKQGAYQEIAHPQ